MIYQKKIKKSGMINTEYIDRPKAKKREIYAEIHRPSKSIGRNISFLSEFDYQGATSFWMDGLDWVDKLDTRELRIEKEET